jgi:hypothetical protein
MGSHYVTALMWFKEGLMMAYWKAKTCSLAIVNTNINFDVQDGDLYCVT